MSFMKYFVLQTRQMQKAAERRAAFERGTYVTTSHYKDVVETEKKKNLCRCNAQSTTEKNESGSYFPLLLMVE